jgi:hypothetical protein
MTPHVKNVGLENGFSEKEYFAYISKTSDKEDTSKSSLIYLTKNIQKFLKIELYNRFYWLSV